MDLCLKIPAPEDKDAVWAFRREMLEYGSSFDGCCDLNLCGNYDAWLSKVWLFLDPANCPKDKVPSATYLAIRSSDGLIVGIIELRYHIDHPVLGLWGGHIGYCVRPSQRGKGFAKQMLMLDLGNAREIGLSRVMVTCDEGNIASEKTILACGGQYERSVTVERGIVKRFWIELEDINVCR